MPPVTNVIDHEVIRLPHARDWLIAMRAAEHAIDEKATAAGLGAQTVGLTDTNDSRGWFKRFQGGLVLFRLDLGAHEVHGDILRRYDELGGTTSFLGFPTTDEQATPKGPGRYNHFEHGSIYWGPQTGAHLVYGAIRDKWASLGWEQGGLGLPVSDEEDVPGAPGARRNRFEGGEITWTPSGGARVTATNVPEGTEHSGVMIRSTGSGGSAPSPEVSRHVIVTAAMDITDDEFWADNEHAHVERRDEVWVDGEDMQAVMNLIGKCGGEVRVELHVTAGVRADGAARVAIETKLFEGTSEESTDLDGQSTINRVVPPGKIVQVPFRINNDDEGGDFADLVLSISNQAT